MKYRSNPTFPSTEITRLSPSIFDNAKTRIDKLHIYFVFPDEDTARIASERFRMPPLISIPPNTTMSTGYLYGDMFVTTSINFSIKAVQAESGLAKFDI